VVIGTSVSALLNIFDKLCLAIGTGAFAASLEDCSATMGVVFLSLELDLILVGNSSTSLDGHAGVNADGCKLTAADLVAFRNCGLLEVLLAFTGLFFRCGEFMSIF
jgi:hypothetical protein